MILDFIKKILPGSHEAISFYGRTDTGRRREHNEDSFCCLQNRGLFVVADGMGGHNAGEVASRLAIESLLEFLDEKRLNDLRGKNEETRRALLDAFEYANRQVIKNAAQHEQQHGMGCTMVACLIDGRLLHTCHVGDARCYVVTTGKLVQVTTDHTGITYGQANGPASHPAPSQRPVVTRAIGFPFPAAPEYHLTSLSHGARVLLCSDGLWNMLDHTRIEHILLNALNPEEACETLVDAANEEGGRDNITALAIFY